MNADDSNNVILQILAMRRATGSPAEWNAIKKAQARKIAGKIEQDKSQEFAKYIERCFMSVCDELHVFEMARDWPQKSEFEKLTIAGDIINRFVKRVQSDMNTGRARKYNDMVVEPAPEISVSRAAGGLMSVSSNGTVNINPDWPFYNDLARFLMDLRHEATHIVDIFFPCLSPLRPDILAKARIFYVDGRDDFGLYKENPLELNANTWRREFGDIVRAKIALCEYNRIRGILGNKMGGTVRGR